MGRFLYALYDDKNHKLADKGAISISHAEAESWNKKGYGIFASVNSFKTSRRIETNLERLEFWFVDLDSGSREMQHRAIQSFALVPTYIISTKNGYHCYWKCEGEQTVQQYKEIVLRLIQFMDGDPNAKDVTRILRVPSFYHMKNPKNPYMIHDLGLDSGVAYTASEMDKHLPELAEELKPKPKALTFSDDINCDKLYSKQSSIHAAVGFEKLSGAPELDGDKITTAQRGDGKFTIFVNDKKVSSCWVDVDGKIGSHDGGGPTVANWINWYHKGDWAKTSEVLKKYFPELNEGAGWILK